MDDIDMKQIVDAYMRIDKSLSGRFEKDVRLYLPMEDVEELKKFIYQAKYERILEKYRLKPNKYTAEVLANVLIKNAWLMQKDKGYKNLFQIFKQCDIYYLSNIMTDGILDNKIEMPLKFRSELISLYLQRLDSNTCEQILCQNHSFLNDSQLRASCACSALKDLPIELRYNKFNEYAHKWPNILLAKREIIELAFPKKEINDVVVCEQILKDYMVSSDERIELNFWIEKLSTNGLRNILILLKTYFQQHSVDERRGKVIAGRIVKILQRDLNNLIDSFADACSSLNRRVATIVAQEVHKRFASEESRRIIENALEEYHIEFEEKENNLADIDFIAEKIDDGNISPKLMGFLVISFDKQYRKTYEKSLREIKRKLSYNGGFDDDDYYDEDYYDEDYDDFVCELAIRRFPNFVPYMLYVMENIAPNDRNVRNKVLKIFEDKDILRTGRKGKLRADEYGQIAEFIKNYDFELFKRLTSY